MAKAKAEETKALTFADVAHEFQMWSDTIEGIDDPAEKEKALAAFAAGMLTQGKEKLDRFAAMLRRFENEASFQKAEAAIHTRRAEILTTAAERLEAYALQAMQAANAKVLEGNVSKFRVQASPAKVTIVDEAAVPSAFKTVTITLPAGSWEEHLKTHMELWKHKYPSLDMEVKDLAIIQAIVKSDTAVSKTAIKKAIDDGREVAGADLDMSGVYLKVTP